MTEGDKPRRAPQDPLPQQDGLLAEGRLKDTMPQARCEGDAKHNHGGQVPVADVHAEPTATHAGPVSDAKKPYAKPSTERSAPRGEHISTVYNLNRANEGGQSQVAASVLSQEAAARYTQASHSSQSPEIRTIDENHEEALRAKDHQIASLQREVEGLRKSVAQLDHRFKTTRSELDAALSHNTHQKQQIEEEHRRRCQGEEEVKKLRNLLQERTEEVKIAQAFTTTADKYSIAEVCQLVEQLNDEIYQCAMGFSDAVRELHSVTPDSIHEAEWRERLDGARRKFGQWDAHVVARLESELKHDDPDTTLLESMVQFLLMRRCFAIIDTFCPQDGVTDDFMRNLWEGVAASHETSVARNWQAITRRSLGPSVKPASRKTLLRQLERLIILCSRDIPSPTAVEEFMTSKFDAMDAKATKVKEAIAEGVLSADVAVIMQGRGKDFNPVEMRDAFESPNKPRLNAEGNGKGGVIICGTGLGVCRITREPDPSGSSGVRKKVEVISKPKVVLYSTLIE